MKTIIGLDPGINTGTAVFEGGILVELLTIRPLEIIDLLTARAPARVVFEDSRLQSVIWSRGRLKPAANLKVARNVGQIDAWCSLITDACARLGIPAHGISPQGKGGKLNAEQFQDATGWAGASNQHNRDAAMVAWPLRNASPRGNE